MASLLESIDISRSMSATENERTGKLDPESSPSAQPEPEPEPRKNRSGPKSKTTTRADSGSDHDAGLESDEPELTPAMNRSAGSLGRGSRTQLNPKLLAGVDDAFVRIFEVSILGVCHLD